MLKKSLLLMIAAMALCAFAVPLTASAASWSPVGTTGFLDSSNVSFSMPALGSASQCRQIRFHVQVTSAAVMTVVGASFSQCHGTVGASSGCTITATGTDAPWTATAVSTNDIRIHGVKVDVRFATTPPAGSTPCARNGIDLLVTGTLGVGTAGQTAWDPATKTVTFINTAGLVGHILGTGLSAVMAANSSFRATGLLNILD